MYKKIRRQQVLGMVVLVAALVGTAVLGIAQARPASAGVAQSGMREGRMGPVHMGAVREWTGFYDGHHVIYLNTDVSSKMEANMMGINFAPGLKSVNGASQPEIYLVQGPAAANQLAVFGSQPGEKDYSPLWRETILTWKSTAKPVLIVSDNQINALEKKGQLTERDAHVLLNCPIIRVMK